MERGKLIILAGIDGSGKSSVLRAIEDSGLIVSHWKKLKSTSLQTKLDFESPAEKVQMLIGRKRLSFISSYILAEWKYLVQPNLKKGVPVVSDGLFIKFFAKECVYNRLNIQHLLKLSPLTGEELVILIDIPAEVALERKNRLGLGITSYECFNGPNDFVQFQRLHRQALLDYVKNFSHRIIDGTPPKEEIASEALIYIKSELRENRANT